jgi:hypothetical protein
MGYLRNTLNWFLTGVAWWCVESRHALTRIHVCLAHDHVAGESRAADCQPHPQLTLPPPRPPPPSLPLH